MIGGHYIAYCLVDPDRMFDGQVTLTETTEPESIDGSEESVEPPVMPAAKQERKASVSSAKSENGSGFKRPSLFGKSSSNSTAHLPSGKKDRRVWCYCSE